METHRRPEELRNASHYATTCLASVTGKYIDPFSSLRQKAL